MLATRARMSGRQEWWKEELPSAWRYELSPLTCSGIAQRKIQIHGQLFPNGSVHLSRFSCWRPSRTHDGSSLSRSLQFSRCPQVSFRLAFSPLLAFECAMTLTAPVVAAPLLLFSKMCEHFHNHQRACSASWPKRKKK